MLEGDRPLLPRQRFYSSHLDAKDITFQQAIFTLRYIVQQRLQEKQLEELEKGKRESEKRRQLEVQHDVIYIRDTSNSAPSNAAQWRTNAACLEPTRRGTSNTI